MAAEPKAYTVLVLYPDATINAMRAEFGHPEPGFTYVARVRAKNCLDARRAGAREAMMKQQNAQRATLEQWTVIAVFSGHPDLEWQL